MAHLCREPGIYSLAGCLKQLALPGWEGEARTGISVLGVTHKSKNHLQSRDGPAWWQDRRRVIVTYNEDQEEEEEKEQKEKQAPSL